MKYVEILNRLETEIKMTIKNEIPLVSPYEFTKTKYKQPLLSDIIIENPEEENLSSALNIVYASSSFMSVDRIIKVNDNFKRNRRIIYYLDSRTGQIGSILLLQLLKAESNGTFSKHELVEKVDKEIFQAEGINISSGEITESLSRMFRKTMADFFFIDGRKLVKKPYMLKVQELKLNQYRIRNYDNYKHQIDNLSNHLMFTLNRMIL